MSGKHKLAYRGKQELSSQMFRFAPNISRGPNRETCFGGLEIYTGEWVKESANNIVDEETWTIAIPLPTRISKSDLGHSYLIPAIDSQVIKE